MRSSIVISFLPVLTAAAAREDAWIAGVIAFFPSAAIVYIIGRLAVAFPEKSIVQYSQELLGGFLGRILPLFYLGLFLFIAGTDLRVYGEVIKTGFLPETPLSVIMGIMVLAAAMVVYAGLEPLGRVADIIFPIFLLMIVGTVLFPLVHADFSNLQPVLAEGWPPVITASITPIAITAQYTALTMLVPSVTEPKKSLGAALLSVFLASIVMVVVAVMVISVLGAEEGARAAFPAFKMVRATSVTEFLERVEALTIFAWGFGLFTSISVNLYCGSRGLSQLIGMQDNRPLILPMSVVWVAFAVQGFRNLFEVKQFFSPEVIGPFVLMIAVFPVLILWAAYFLKRLGRGDHEHHQK
jgi:spore germination protein KB